MNNGSLILGGPENGKWIVWLGLIYDVIIPKKPVLEHLIEPEKFTYRRVPLAGGHTVFIPLNWQGPDQQKLIIKALLNLAS